MRQKVSLLTAGYKVCLCHYCVYIWIFQHPKIQLLTPPLPDIRCFHLEACFIFVQLYVYGTLPALLSACTDLVGSFFRLHAVQVV